MEDGSSVFNTLDFSESSIEEEHIKRDTHNLLKAFIKDLPETQREVLVMRHYMKMSFQEIADATDVSINTALGRMRYALINMRKMATGLHYLAVGSFALAVTYLSIFNLIWGNPKRTRVRTLSMSA